MMSSRLDPLAAGRLRGMLLGLALGDSVGGVRGAIPDNGWLRAGVSTQLAALTAEGVIRAVMRSDHEGICHPPGVVWHAYCRWAALQGIERDRLAAQWRTGSLGPWPDGWLTEVPVLGERRGSAPATVAALRGREPGTVESPRGTSRGAHAVTRAFPIAAAGFTGDMDFVGTFARAVAALTHGDPEAQAASAAAVMIAAHALTTGSLEDALSGASRAKIGTAAGHSLTEELSSVVMTAQRQPADVEVLRRLAPDATARSALLGGLYAARSFTDPARAAAALHFAAHAPDADSVATVAGALLGATHGADVWPVGLVSRHELAWVLDTLARDLVAQLTDKPGGDEYTPPTDPAWWGRYPGW